MISVSSFVGFKLNETSIRNKADVDNGDSTVNFESNEMQQSNQKNVNSVQCQQDNAHVNEKNIVEINDGRKEKDGDCLKGEFGIINPLKTIRF